MAKRICAFGQPLTHPTQCRRGGNGVNHRLAAQSGLQMGLFQLEVPLGGAVSVVNQHKVGIASETFGLHFHGSLVLTNEGAGEETEN